MSNEELKSLNRKIKDTQLQINEIEKSSDNLSTIAQLTLKELNRRLNSLEKQKTNVIDAQTKETVTLRLYGDKVNYGKISNRVLILVLSGFQTLIDSMATYITGSVAKYGKISNNAREITDFNVAGTFEGSFGIILEKNYEQMELLSNMTDTGRLLKNLFDILENSENPERLAEQIIPYGKRTINHYKEWLKNLEKEDVNLEVGWINEDVELRKFDINYSKVGDVINTLNNIEVIKNEEIKIKGILTGINIRNNTFELKTDNGIIKGKSKIETLISISNLLGEKIEVGVIKSTLQSSSFVSKTTWYLKTFIKELQ